MNKFYLLGVFANRIISVANVMMLTYLLLPADFGAFSLAITNVLMTQIIAGWWITSAAYKYLTDTDEGRVDQYISSIALSGVAMVPIAMIAVFVVAVEFSGASTAQGLIMSLWVFALIFSDLTLAANNALGMSREYATLAMARNALAVAASLILVLLGMRGLGAMMGQMIGVLVPLFFVTSATRFWLRARPSLASSAMIYEMAKFGIAGAASLGLYMLTQGFARNVIETKLGIAAAGQFALAIDLFNAPLILVGSAFSLSRMRSLYQLGAEQDVLQSKEEASHFFEICLLFSMPYALAGAVVAPALALLVIGPNMALGVASIAAAATMQAGMIPILAGLVTIMLVFDQRKRVVAVVVGASIANALAVSMSASGGLINAAWYSTATMAMTTCVTWTMLLASGRLLPSWSRWLKLVACAAVSAVVCWVWFDELGFREPFSTILLGSLVYIGATTVLKLVDWPHLFKSHGLSMIKSEA